MHSLDLETSSISGDLSDYMALEPWRARQGKGFISSLHVYGDVHDIHIKRPTREQLIEVLEKLRGEEVYAHFALFDVAWLIASIEPNRLGPLHSAIKGVPGMAISPTVTGTRATLPSNGAVRVCKPDCVAATPAWACNALTCAWAACHWAWALSSAAWLM